MIEVIVFGEPGPKGSKSIGRRKNGTSFVRESSKRVKPWEKAVSEAVADVTPAMLEPPYAITLDFHWPRPKRPTWLWPSKDDLDKLARATIDGIVKAGAILDDRHVISLRTDKRWLTGVEGAHCAITICSTSP